MANFSSYIPLLIEVEGGYQAHPQDNGNYNSNGVLVGTNHGISAPVYESWIGYPPTVADMQTMTRTVALEIYKAWYWNKVRGNDIENQSVANIIVDHAVNAGVAAAGKMVQRTLNNEFGFNLTVDGVIGSQTIAAINGVHQNQFHDALYEARKQHYYNIGGTFLNGWLIRLTKFVFSEKKNC